MIPKQQQEFVNFSPFYVKFIAGLAAEGGQCTQNTDCQSTLLCDGNKKLCRKNATQLTNADRSFCNNNLCQEWEGECDEDSQCAGSLKCGENNCPAQFNWHAERDCCYESGNDTIVFPFHKNWDSGQMGGLMYMYTIFAHC